jgi:predicted RNA-binding Zn-ribbon protein involved in translation (DUF1610 family)
MLRKITRPGAATVLKRFREAYSTHHCPICSYPIARGVLKQAVWTRKGPRPLPTITSADAGEETPYACPSCGTRLYEPCEACGNHRHSLLPYCDHCGHRKSIAEMNEPI